MTVSPAMEPTARPARTALERHYLMCRPEHFAVTYAINPWMDPEAGADAARAVEQWEARTRRWATG
jgi:hypothetical protein